LGLTGLVVSVVAIDPFFQKSFLSQALSFSLVSFSTALLFPALLKIHLKEGFVKSLVYRLSVYSYTIYLCHFQWQFIYHKFFTQQFDFKGYVLDFWFSLTYLMTVVIFSFLWYHFVESKITNLRRYLR
jgi:peptidoglycan/LPS O-acetylase OafA/YrhL